MARALAYVCVNDATKKKKASVVATDEPFYSQAKNFLFCNLSLTIVAVAEVDPTATQQAAPICCPISRVRHRQTFDGI